VVSADKAAVSSGAPGASAAGVLAGHGDYVSHDKPSAASAGFGGARTCARGCRSSAANPHPV